MTDGVAGSIAPAGIPVAPAVQEVRTKDGVVLKVTELKRSRVIACMRRSGWKGSDDAGGLATLKMLLFMAAVSEAVGVNAADGKPFRSTKDPEIGLVMPVDLYDAVDSAAAERIAGIAAPELFTVVGPQAESVEQTRGN